MQIMCKAASPHHHELQPNWLFDQNRVTNRYSSILQLHNGSADMIAKTSLCAKTVSLFAKQTTRLSMCNTCCGDRKGFIRRILLRQQTNYQKSLANTFVWEKLAHEILYRIKYCFKIMKIKNSNTATTYIDITIIIIDSDTVSIHNKQTTSLIFLLGWQ